MGRRGPNGGYVAAVILRAIQAAAGAERAPRSLTVHFPRAPLAGPGRDRGRESSARAAAVTFLSARMDAGRRGAGDGAGGARGRLERRGFAELGMPDVGRARGAAHARPGPGPARRRCCRTTASGRPSASAAFSGGAPRTGVWIRTREPRLLDAPLAAAILDAWFPAPFVRARAPAAGADDRLHRPLPLAAAPARRRAEDAYLVTFSSGLARHGFFEEDGELWSRRRDPAGAVAAAGAAARRELKTVLSKAASAGSPA